MSIIFEIGFIWLQEVLWFLHNQKELNKLNTSKTEPLAFRVPFLEHEFRNIEPLTLLKKYPSPRLMKSHLSRHHLEKQMEDVSLSESKQHINI